MIPASMRGWRIRRISIPFRENLHLFLRNSLQIRGFSKGAELLTDSDILRNLMYFQIALRDDIGYTLKQSGEKTA